MKKYIFIIVIMMVFSVFSFNSLAHSESIYYEVETLDQLVDAIENNEKNIMITKEIEIDKEVNIGRNDGIINLYTKKNGGYFMFNVLDKGKLNLNNLVIDGLNQSKEDKGGGIINYGELNIFGESFIFRNNSDGSENIEGGIVDSGGAIFNDGELNINVENLTFEKNYSYIGGAISNSVGSSMKIESRENLIFDSNKANIGGAIFNWEKSNIEINSGNIKFVNNESNFGSCIYSKINSKIVINSEDIDFESNVSIPGSGIYNDGEMDIVGKDIKFRDNNSCIYNGHNADADLRISGLNIEFSDNHCGDKGLISHKNGNFLIIAEENLEFLNNKNGTIYNKGEKFDIITKDLSIKNTNNYDNKFYGIIHNLGDMTISSNNMEIEENLTSSYGTIYNIGELEIENKQSSIFLNNKSELDSAVINNKGRFKFNNFNDIELINNISGLEGAIYNDPNGDMIINTKNILFEENKGTIGGGINNLGNLNINSERFKCIGNNALYGGAIYNGNNLIIISDEIEIKENTAKLGGGGIKNDEKGRFILSNYDIPDKKFYIGSNTKFIDNTSLKYHLISEEDILKYHSDIDSQYFIDNKVNSSLSFLFDTPLNNYDIHCLSENVISKDGYEIQIYGVDPKDIRVYIGKVEGKYNIFDELVRKDTLGQIYDILDKTNLKYDKENQVFNDFVSGINTDKVVLEDKFLKIYIPIDYIDLEGDGNTNVILPEVKPVDPVKPPKPEINDKEIDQEKEEEINQNFNSKDHMAYINGYEDGTIKPENSISREEASAIIYRLLERNFRGSIKSNDYTFNDSIHSWSKKYVATMANGKIVEGYEDNTFRPRNSITRAEAITILGRILEDSKIEKTSNLSDIDNHWAEEFIIKGINLDIIEGYEDGTFRPDEKITRAEFVTMMNRTLDRKVQRDNILEDIIEYKDLRQDAWYYTQMVEASNGHDYEEIRLEDGSEIWTKLIFNDIEL